MSSETDNQIPWTTEEEQEFQRMASRRNVKLDQIAKVAHEVNRAYCRALGDNSLAAWEISSKEQRTSILTGVVLNLNSPDNSPEGSHNSWMEHKRAEGWSYGPVKDLVNKTHPCFLPYAELPTEMRVKDFLFQAVVRAMR